MINDLEKVLERMEDYLISLERSLNKNIIKLEDIGLYIASKIVEVRKVLSLSNSNNWEMRFFNTIDTLKEVELLINKMNEVSIEKYDEISLEELGDGEYII